MQTTIKVNKQKLLEVLKSNREEFLTIYEAAMEKYRAAAIEKLESMLDAAKNGEKIQHSFQLAVPNNYENDFSEAIAMIEWAIGDEIELDSSDFSCYVLNKWHWIDSFAGSVGAYGLQGPTGAMGTTRKASY